MGHADACRARCDAAGALRLTAAYTMKSRRHCAPATILLSLMLGACAGTHGEANKDLDAGAQVSGSMAGQEMTADTGSYTPFQKMEDAQIARDQGIYRDTQARIAELNARKGVRLGSYALAKAQCWLDVSFHEYTRNDRGGFPRGVLPRRCIQHLLIGPQDGALQRRCINRLPLVCHIVNGGDHQPARDFPRCTVVLLQ